MADRTTAAIAEDYLDVEGSTALIERPTRVRDATGGYSDTPSTVESGVPCRVSPLGDPTEGEIAQKLRGRPGYRIRLPFRIELKLQDTVTVDGRAFDIVSVKRPPDASATLGVGVE